VKYNFRRLPQEMQKLKQWAIAGGDGAPLVVSGSSLKNISIHSVNELMTFEDACAFAERNKVLIGFVLTKDDPFTCIDMDVCDADSQKKKNKPIDPTKWTTKKDFERYSAIVEAFDSYTELSRSGKGLHVWAYGSIGLGARRDGVEVYSQERFIICTGNVYKDIPIKENQQYFDMLVGEMRQSESKADELVEIEPIYEDSEIFEIAITAENGDKFDKLAKGEWQDLGYPSQSEADLSLLSILCFYSESNEQCRRLFRYSALGKREKCQKDNRYLDKTLKLIRGRQDREATEMVNSEELARELIRELQTKVTTKAIDAAHIASTVENPVVSGLDWPPGFAGAIAGFIFNSAPRPVKEVAIVATLGLLAGICGKAWSLPQTGLNVYIILVARSAIGKEAMHSGLSHILAKLRESTPAASAFVDFSDFASGPALVKACASNNSFVNVAGEWGKKLRRFATEDKTDGPMQQLRTVMTNMYQKSGPAAIVGGLTYSKKEDNIASISGVAYSMIGETTPGTFYDSLTENMMEDGFLSRFSIVEYDGDRPPANRSPMTALPNELADALSGLCVHALTLLQRFQSCPVEYDPAAKILFDEFDKECDREINSTRNESKRQMWNRAHLKAIRISALLAVADNWINPVITLVHASWALSLIRKDIGILSKRILNGDIGTDDCARQRKIIKILEGYLLADSIASSYGISPEMHSAGVIPRKYIQIQCQTSAFKNFAGGVTLAMDLALKSLIDDGSIIEVSKTKVAEDYKCSGKCYMVVDISIFRRDW